jgi:hypothetical protein
MYTDRAAHHTALASKKPSCHPSRVLLRASLCPM